MAHRILVRVGPPFIQVLVQKSVTAITNLAGRLSPRMLRERCMNSQEGAKENLLPRFDVELWMDRPNPLNGIPHREQQMKRHDPKIVPFQYQRTNYFFGCGRLAGGTMPFMRKYSTIWP